MIAGRYDEISVTDEALCQQFLNNRLDELDETELPPSLARLSELALDFPNVPGGSMAGSPSGPTLGTRAALPPRSRAEESIRDDSSPARDRRAA